MSKKVWRTVIILAMLTGWVGSTAFGAAYLLTGLFIGFSLLAIGVIIDIIINSHTFSRVTGILSFFLIANVTSGICMSISENISRNLPTKSSKQAMNTSAKNDHFSEKSVYSLHLDKVALTRFKKQQHYSTDRNLQDFTIRAWDDGWNIKVYRLRDGEWVMED